MLCQRMAPKRTPVSAIESFLPAFEVLGDVFGALGVEEAFEDVLQRSRDAGESAELVRRVECGDFAFAEDDNAVGKVSTTSGMGADSTLTSM